MDERMDNKTRNALLGALQRAKTFSQQLQENREQRLWKNINIPCYLSDAINGLSKK